MKQAYFAALDRHQAQHLPHGGSGLFHPIKGHLQLAVTGEIRPCAASAGVSYEELSALIPLVGYEPPGPDNHANQNGSGLNGSLSQKKAPVSLALLQTQAAGRVLSHGTLAPASEGVPSHSFTHVLLDVPTTLDAHQAIQTWGSEQWQCSAADGLGQLSDSLFPPVSDELDDKTFTLFLKETQTKELFQFVLAAMLETNEDTQIFVAAPSEIVAACIYGLTRALPSPILDTITFSTYEHDPLKCPARIVGTIPSSEGKELPPSCHDGAGVGINYFTGTKTSIDMDIPYVEFAVQVLASGNVGPLDDFRATWQRLGIKDGSLLDVVYRLGRGPDAITKVEAVKALQDSSLAAWVSPRPEYQKLFLDWSLEDIDFATNTFPRVVTALRQKSDHLTRIAGTIREAGLAAVNAGDLTKTRCALEVLLPMVSPASGSSIWGEILQKQSDPDALSWDMRTYLLPKLARLRPLTVGQTPDADMARWLRIPADKLSSLLSMSLSQGYQITTCLEMLQGGGENLQTVAHALAGNQQMAMTVLQQLLNTAEGKSTAHELFGKLLSEAPSPSWLLDVMKLEPPVPASFLNHCLGTALDHGVQAIDPIPFVKQHGTALLERLGGQGNLDRLAGQLLEGQAGELLGDAALRSFFMGLENKQGLSGTVEERLRAMLKVHRYFEQPTVRPDQLEAVAKAVQLEPKLFSPATQAKLLRAAMSCMDAATFQDDLVALLLNWGPIFGGPSHLYRECLKHSQESKTFWKNQEQLQAYLAVALDGTTSDALNAQTEGLEAEAYSLVDNLVRRGGKKAWEEMNNHIADWPRPAKRQWQFLSRALTPTSSRGVTRDVLAMLVGAVVMAVVFVALKWWGVW